MKTVFYSGSLGQACRAHYALVERAAHPGCIDILVLHSPAAPGELTLPRSSEARDTILNHLLVQEFRGIGVDFLRFFVLTETLHGDLDGAEYPIQLDVEDYVKQGHEHWHTRCVQPSRWDRWVPWRRFGAAQIHYDWREIVGGCARFFTDRPQARALSAQEVALLCHAAGYHRAFTPMMLPPHRASPAGARMH